MDINKIINDYSETKSIWKVGELNGLRGQTVHSILNKNGIDTSSKNKWTKEQESELIQIYNLGFMYGDNTLDLFCTKHNKLKSNVCRKAKNLGLKTSNSREFTKEAKEKTSINAKKWIKEKGHPKGFLNGKHTEVSKRLMSDSSKRMWQNPNSFVNTDNHRQDLSDRASKNMEKRLNNSSGNMYSRTKNGTIEIGNKKIFVRSSWEANICAYFEFLKSKGEIKEWNYEPKTFWFLAIKRGVRSYKPDFLITDKNGNLYYEEVKGWLDAKSKTKLSRMAKYYPEIDLRLLDKKRYNEISKMKGLIPNWGLLD